MKKKSIKKSFQTVKEMDAYLENTDLSEQFDKNGELAHQQTKKINLDLPQNMVHQIDKIATNIGVSRQPLLKLWIHEKLKEELGGD